MKKFLRNTKLLWIYWIVMLVSTVFKWFEIIPTYNDIFFYIIYFIFGAAAVAIGGIKDSKNGLILLEVQFIVFALLELILGWIYSGESAFVWFIPYLGNCIFANENYGSGIRRASVLALILIYPVVIALIGNALYKLRKKRME